MKTYGVILSIFLAGCGSGSGNNEEPLSLDIQPLKSTDIHYGNSDLQGFIKAVEGIDVVGVGERTHQGSKAYSYKARMAKALHQEGNLELIAFEAGLYDGLSAWQSYLNNQQSIGEAVIGPNANYMYGHRYSQEVQGLLAYVQTLDQTTRPLLLVGYDARINSDPGCSVMFDELETYLNSKGILTTTYDDIKTLAPRMMCPWYANTPFTHVDHRILINELTTLIALLTEQKKAEVVPAYNPQQPREFRDYASFWLQVTKSLKAQSHFIINDIDNRFTNDQSAENLKWLIDEWFGITGQTFVWAHNIHATPVYASMIEALHKRYPDVTTYNVMQMGYKGTLAANTHEHHRWLDDVETFIEEQDTLNFRLFDNQYPDSFIDFHAQNKANKSFLSRPVNMRYAWGALYAESPNKIMDGMLFIPIEEPAKPIN